jgi:hypothetical protein
MLLQIAMFVELHVMFMSIAQTVLVICCSSSVLIAKNNWMVVAVRNVKISFISLRKSKKKNERE